MTKNLYVQDNDFEVIQLIGSYETAFFLFMFSGLYSSMRFFAQLPVEPTAIFALLTIIMACYLWYQDEWETSPIIIISLLAYICFAGWATISLIWAPSESYALNKVFRLNTITFWAVAGYILVIGQSKKRFHRFLQIIFISSVIVAIITFYKYPFDGFTLSIAGSNHILPGRLMGAGSIIALYWFYQTQKKHLRILLLGIAFSNGFATLIAGSRQAFLALIIAGFIWVLLMTLDSSLYVRLRQPIKEMIGIIFAIVPITLFISVIKPSLISNITAIRISRGLLELQIPSSIQSRFNLWNLATEMWLQSPIMGQGIGAFPVIAFGPGSSTYPHNLILEILAELGLIGLTLFLILVSICVIRLYRYNSITSDDTAVFLFSFALYWFITAMFSWDMAGNRQFFMALAMMCSSIKVLTK